MEEEDAMDTEGVATSFGILQSPGLIPLAGNCPAPQPTPPSSLLPAEHHQCPDVQSHNVPLGLGAQTCSPTLEEVANTRYTSAISQQISVAEFNMQGHYMTQQALRDLKASPEYKKHAMKCHR